MIIFTPLTFISSIACYRMAVEKKEIETWDNERKDIKTYKYN